MDKTIRAFIIAVLLFVPRVWSATIVGTLQDIFGRPLESWVVFKPEWTPYANGNNVVTGPAYQVYATNGTFVVTNLLAGRYTVSFPSVGRDICIMVPTNTPSVYPFAYLASLCTNMPQVVSLVTNSVAFAYYGLADDVPADSGLTPIILAFQP